MLSTPAKYCWGVMRQQRLRMSAFLRWEALVAPSHHTLARWHISQSSNLLQTSFSSSSSPSNCTSLTFSRCPPNTYSYRPGSRALSYSMSFLNTSCELHATKAGRLASRSLRITPVVGSFRMVMTYSGKSFFSMLFSTIARIFFAIALLPARTDRTAYTFSSSSSPYSYSSPSYYSSSSSSSSSARTTLPTDLFATSASASSALVVLVICAYLRRMVLREWQQSSWISPTMKLTSICSTCPPSTWFRSMSAFYDDSDSDSTYSFPFPFPFPFSFSPFCYCFCCFCYCLEGRLLGLGIVEIIRQ